jgi:hypothetical protein
MTKALNSEIFHSQSSNVFVPALEEGLVELRTALTEEQETLEKAMVKPAAAVTAGRSKSFFRSIDFLVDQSINHIHFTLYA